MKRLPPIFLPHTADPPIVAKKTSPYKNVNI